MHRGQHNQNYVFSKRLRGLIDEYLKITPRTPKPETKTKSSKYFTNCEMISADNSNIFHKLESYLPGRQRSFANQHHFSSRICFTIIFFLNYELAIQIKRKTEESHKEGFSSLAGRRWTRAPGQRSH